MRGANAENVLCQQRSRFSKNLERLALLFEFERSLDLKIKILKDPALGGFRSGGSPASGSARAPAQPGLRFSPGSGGFRSGGCPLSGGEPGHRGEPGLRGSPWSPLRGGVPAPGEPSLGGPLRRIPLQAGGDPATGDSPPGGARAPG